MSRLPFPHLVLISPEKVEPPVRAVGERVLTLTQRSLRLEGVRLKWFWQRWLLPGKPYSRETVESWGVPLDDPTVNPEASVVNIGCHAGEAYHGRTLPLFSTSLFVCAASLPVFSDEGDMKPVTPYRAGVTVAHEIRHLWQVAHGWPIRGRERDAICFAATWRKRVREAVKRG